MDFVDTLQVRNGSCLIYKDYPMRSCKKVRSILTQNFKGRKTYSGDITDSTAKRIRRTVSVFCQRTKKQVVFNPITGRKQIFQFGFLTITVPDLTTNDQSYYYKNLLKPLLRYLTGRFGKFEYIWKAEVQSRGSIHYHVTLNHFIPFNYILSKWNELLDKNGLMEDFKLKYGHSNPNSIDLHSVRNVTNLEAYLIKYIAKKDKNGYSFKGKVWGCSESLQGAKYFSEWLSSEAKDKIKSIADKGGVIIKHLEQCTIIHFIKGYSLKDVSNSIYNSYLDWCGFQREIPLVTI